MKALLIALSLLLAVNAGAQTTTIRADRVTYPVATALTTLSSTTCPGTGCVVLTLTGHASVGIQVSGALSGTLEFEAAGVDAPSYVPLAMTPLNGGTLVTSATAEGVWTAPTGGLTSVRVRFSAYTSGTPTVSMSGTYAQAASSSTVYAPPGAQYITQVPDAGLTAEQALSALASGILRVNTATGVLTSLTDSAGIAANISDETGTGSMVFSASPTFTGTVTAAALKTTVLTAGTTHTTGKVSEFNVSGTVINETAYDRTGAAYIGREWHALSYTWGVNGATTGMTLSSAGALAVTAGISGTTGTLSGSVAVGTALDTTMGLKIAPASLTSAYQYGLFEDMTSTSGATGYIMGGFFRVRTPAAAFTVPAAYALFVDALVKGAGSTVTTQYGLYIENQNSGTTNYSIYTNGGSIRLGGLGLGYVCSDASAVLSYGATCSTSSRALKDDIDPLEINADAILRLTPVSFNWKADGRRDFGLIAEDVAPILPELVTKTSDDRVVVRYDMIGLLLLPKVKQLELRIEQLERKPQ